MGSLDNSAFLHHNKAMTLQRLREPVYPAAADGASTGSGMGKEAPAESGSGPPRRGGRLGAQSTSARLSPGKFSPRWGAGKGQAAFFPGEWGVLPQRSYDERFFCTCSKGGPSLVNIRKGHNGKGKEQ